MSDFFWNLHVTILHFHVNSSSVRVMVNTLSVEMKAQFFDFEVALSAVTMKSLRKPRCAFDRICSGFESI